ncbi:hypothetical protein EVY37_20815 [Klebsiella pneumoniae]|nr:hypothetical protein EVY37_20815 [Klebsiella pneumoniae]
MVLHAFSRSVTPFAALSRRGLSLPMHLHENRPTKRAGEAGKALRARLHLRIYFRSLSASLCRAGSRGC